jgi:hypothetical protein
MVGDREGLRRLEQLAQLFHPRVPVPKDRFRTLPSPEVYRWGLLAQTVIQATAHLVALTVVQVVVRMELDLMEEMVLKMLKVHQVKGKMMLPGH